MKFGTDADDDPFVKVKDLIMDFSRLQAEASSETNQKSCCDEGTIALPLHVVLALVCCLQNVAEDRCPPDHCI